MGKVTKHRAALSALLPGCGGSDPVPRPDRQARVQIDSGTGKKGTCPGKSGSGRFSQPYPSYTALKAARRISKLVTGASCSACPANIMQPAILSLVAHSFAPVMVALKCHAPAEGGSRSSRHAATQCMKCGMASQLTFLISAALHGTCFTRAVSTVT